MSVAMILAAKSPEVFTVAPHRTLQEASELLSRKRIGAVIVSDAAGQVLGILSERDIVREIGLRGSGVLGDPVSAHMTSRVVTTDSRDTVDHVMELMVDGNFRHLPVVNGRRLIGVVSIGDVVKFRMDSMQYEATAMRKYINAA